MSNSFDQAGQEDAGLYTCTASNVHGVKETEIDVNVDCKCLPKNYPYFLSASPSHFLKKYPHCAIMALVKLMPKYD